MWGRNHQMLNDLLHLQLETLCCSQDEGLDALYIAGHQREQGELDPIT